MNRRTFKMLPILAAVFLFASVIYAASQADKPQGSKAKSMGKTTVTGCLQKGDEPNEYSITDNGKTYGLRSRSVDLSKHLGHTVSVTGTLRPESAEKEANEKNEAKEQHEGNKEAGDIRVTSLKMVKEGCQ